MDNSRRRMRRMYMYASGTMRRMMRKKIPGAVLIPRAFFSRGSCVVGMLVCWWLVVLRNGGEVYAQRKRCRF